jgi:hypothetical protein
MNIVKAPKESVKTTLETGQSTLQGFRQENVLFFGYILVNFWG